MGINMSVAAATAAAAAAAAVAAAATEATTIATAATTDLVGEKSIVFAFSRWQRLQKLRKELRKESSHAHEYKLSNNNKVIVEHVVVEE